jgi:NADH-quinone oxidoreductase subunit N
MAGFRRTDLRSNESSLKYFILGSFSSAFFALRHRARLRRNRDGSRHSGNNEHHVDCRPHYIERRDISAASFAGAAMLLVGFGFKVATAPFHVWTPDVYEGAPTPVTAFMAAGPKAAGFASFLRVFVFGFPFVAATASTAGLAHDAWLTSLVVLAVLTMTIGNVAAIVQSNVKRLLAYSSIAHAGYALVGFVAAGAAADLAQRDEALGSCLLLTYALMNLGAFAIVTIMARNNDSRTEIEDYNGIGFRAPALAFTLSLFC